MNTGKADITGMPGMRVWTKLSVKTHYNSESKINELEQGIRKSVGQHDLGQLGLVLIKFSQEPNPRGKKQGSLKG